MILTYYRMSAGRLCVYHISSIDDHRIAFGMSVSSPDLTSVT